MKKSVLLFSLAAFLIFAVTVTCSLTGCKSDDSAGEENKYHRITAEEAKAMIDRGGVTTVDVRRPEEYAQGHIEGAVLVTNETIGNDMPSELPDRDAVLLVYCRSGRRSREASMKLLELGYRNVYDFGGIIDWPYGTVKE